MESKNNKGILTLLRAGYKSTVEVNGLIENGYSMTYCFRKEYQGVEIKITITQFLDIEVWVECVDSIWIEVHGVWLEFPTDIDIESTVIGLQLVKNVSSLNL